MKDQKKYYSIYLEVKNKILSGELEADGKLPSKRVMADMRGVSLITVERAYAMLEDEGYIYARERSGYFVSHISRLTASEPSQVRPPVRHMREEHTRPQERDFEYSL